MGSYTNSPALSLVKAGSRSPKGRRRSSVQQASHLIGVRGNARSGEVIARIWNADDYPLTHCRRQELRSGFDS